MRSISCVRRNKRSGDEILGGREAWRDDIGHINIGTLGEHARFFKNYYNFPEERRCRRTGETVIVQVIQKPTWKNGEQVTGQPKEKIREV